MSPDTPRSSADRISGADFETRRADLPESGRWHELHEGRLVLLSAPEEIHGTIVLNLSRLLAVWLQSRPPGQGGYACHGLGLPVESSPDTLYFPAVSFFRGSSSFLQADRVIASEIPDLVIDIASTNDRRSDMRRRTTAYLRHGVGVIWVPDPFKKEVQVISRGGHTLALGSWQTLEGGPLLPGFAVPVEQLFAQPKWWDGRVPECRVVTDPEESV